MRFTVLNVTDWLQCVKRAWSDILITDLNAMEASVITADGCYGNVHDVIGKQSPPAEKTDVRQVPYDYYRKHGDEIVETGRVRSTKPYACADCRYATDRKNNLRRHRATMHERCERALECCGLTFVSKSELREHVTENHGAGAGYACAECGRRFGRRALMRRHAVIHNERPTTDDQRRRQSKGVLSTDRRYACRECDYTTGHKSNLERHLRRHTGLHPTAADSLSAFSDDNHYLPLTTDCTDNNQPTTVSTVNHRDLNVPRNGCCCHICLSTLYYRHKLPSTSPSTSSSSFRAPFMFNFLPPRLADVAWSFRKSILPDVDTRQLWSVEAGDRAPSTEARTDTSDLVDDRSTSKGTADQLKIADGVDQEVSGNRTTSSTSSVGDEPPDAAANDVTDTCYQCILPLLRGCAGNEQLRAVNGLHCDWSTSLTASSGDDARDVTDTCYRRRRRLRLLPLLHTCRSCSLTFASQLQLKCHSDLFHRANDLDVAAARPICCRVNQPDVQQS